MHAPGGMRLRGVLFMGAGIFCLCINDAFAKALTASYSPIQVFFLRTLIALPFAFAMAFATGGRDALRTRRLAVHVLRGLLWIAATILFFTGLRHLELAEATALVFVAPIFITALSALVLHEPVGRARWLAVLTGFIGALIVIRPGATLFQAVSLLPVATALIYAILMIAARWVDVRESVWTLLFYMTATSLALSGILVPFVWITPAADDLWMFLAITAFGTAGITLITQAFRIAPAIVVAPIDYTALIWASLFGWLLWGEWPDAATYSGAAIIILSGSFIILRDGKDSREARHR